MIKPEPPVKQHRMTINNSDFIVDWKLENDQIKIVEVHIIYHDNPDLLNYLSGKIFKMMVQHIERFELNKE